MTTPHDILLTAMATETRDWSDAQKAALLHRLDREATRLTIRDARPTAGALAQSIDASTVQTPALDAIDQAIEWALSTPDARLAISLSPQEGKTTRVGVWGTLRALVQNPDRRCVIASYSDHLARSTARTARNIIREAGTGATDPLTGAALPDRLGLALAEDKSAAGNWKLAGHKGGMYAVGVGGSLTGQPADCVVSDTGIITSYGSLTAAEVHDRHPEYVLGYDHVAQRASWRRLEATRRISSRRVITIETEAGNVLTCTPDHRVYTRRGYVAAGSVRPGETLLYVDASAGMSDLRNDVRARESGHPKSDPKKVNTDMFDGVRPPVDSEDPTDSLLRVRQPNSAQPEENLLRSLPESMVRRTCTTTNVPGVRDELSSPESPDGLLREDVRRPCALEAHEERGELELQDRDVLRTPLPVDAANRDGARRMEVRGVRRPPLAEEVHPNRGRNHPVEPDCASHQRKDGGQSAGESHHAVPRVPHEAPQVREDTVRLVRDGGEKTHDVYDLQVEGTRNFFADGLLVHNCLIIDDPLKGMAEADSRVEREKVIAWWESVAQTRMAPGAPIIVIMTRWHNEDLVGHVLKQDEQRPENEREWRVINIPAISTPGIADSLDREPGVAMESARGRTLEDFRRIQANVGERVWSALYLGSPTPAEGGLFNRAWFDQHRADTPPTDAASRIVAVDPAETGDGDEAGIIGVTVTPDARVWVTDDVSGKMTSEAWARRAVLLALQNRAGEVSFEAYTTGPTYERIIRDAWRRIRDEARLLSIHAGDLAVAAMAYGQREEAPADPMTALADVQGVPVPDQTDPPFRIHGWRGKGDKTARATGTRQAAETGRLRIVGHHTELESQATAWQAGQSSPDRMDALVQAFERGIQLVGAPAQLASPAGAPSASSRPSGGFWNSVIG